MKPDSASSAGEIALPRPALRGRVSVEQALAARRSVREFTDEPLDLATLSQLLWAAQGVSGPDGLRTAPSAGALYPLELYVARLDGCHRYEPSRSALVRCVERDLRPALCRAALSQECVRQAPTVFVFVAVIERMARKYGPELAPRYVHMEIGHAAQNLLLQAAALGWAGVPVGAFHEDRAGAAMGLPADHVPLYLVPIGRPR